VLINKINSLVSLIVAGSRYLSLLTVPNLCQMC